MIKSEDVFIMTHSLYKIVLGMVFCWSSVLGMLETRENIENNVIQQFIQAIDQHITNNHINIGPGAHRFLQNANNMMTSPERAQFVRTFINDYYLEINELVQLRQNDDAGWRLMVTDFVPVLQEHEVRFNELAQNEQVLIIRGIARALIEHLDHFPVEFGEGDQNFLRTLFEGIIQSPGVARRVFTYLTAQHINIYELSQLQQNNHLQWGLRIPVILNRLLLHRQELEQQLNVIRPIIRDLNQHIANNPGVVGPGLAGILNYVNQILQDPAIAQQLQSFIDHYDRLNLLAMYPQDHNARLLAILAILGFLQPHENRFLQANQFIENYLQQNPDGGLFAFAREILPVLTNIRLQEGGEIESFLPTLYAGDPQVIPGRELHQFFNRLEDVFRDTYQAFGNINQDAPQPDPDLHPLRTDTPEFQQIMRYLHVLRDMNLDDEGPFATLIQQMQEPDENGNFVINSNNELQQLYQQINAAWTARFAQEHLILMRMFRDIVAAVTNNPGGEVARLVGQIRAGLGQVNLTNAGQLGHVIQMLLTGQNPVELGVNGEVINLAGLLRQLIQLVPGVPQVQTMVQRWVGADPTTPEGALATLRFAQSIAQIVDEIPLQEIEQNIHNFEHRSPRELYDEYIALHDTELADWLKKQITLASFDLNDRANVAYPWSANLVVGSYDATTALFFLLNMMVEKKLYHQFSTYFSKELCLGFTQKRDQLIQAYNSCKLTDADERNDYLFNEFLKTFAPGPKINMQLISSIGFSLVLHYIVNLSENMLIEQSKVGTLWRAGESVYRFALDHDQEVDGRDPRSPVSLWLQPNQGIVEIRPVSLTTETLKLATMLSFQNMKSLSGSIKEFQTLMSYLFMSQAASMRGFLLRLVASQYPKGHWYRKIVDGVSELTESSVFQTAKYACIWYGCVKALYAYHKQSLQSYLLENKERLLTCMHKAAHAAKGSREAKEVDDQIKQMLQDSTHQPAFWGWLGEKNSSFNRVAASIESILMLPVWIEGIKYMINQYADNV